MAKISLKKVLKETKRTTIVVSGKNPLGHKSSYFHGGEKIKNE